MRQDWLLARVRELSALTNGYPFDSSLFSDEDDVPLIRIRDLLTEPFETFVSSDVVPESALVRDDDVIIGMDGDFNCVLWKRGPAALNQRLCLLRSSNRSDPRFLAYALPDPLRVINDLTYATTVKHLSSFQVTAIRLPTPPLTEQVAIADYLDCETARIDALIGKQQQLAGMLHERRVAVIDKMISPTSAPLQSLEGLAVGGITSGVDYSADEGESDWPRYVRTTDVSGMATLHASGVRRISPIQAGASLIQRNDILFTRSGSLGKNYLHESDKIMAFAGYMIRFRPKSNKCQARYVAWWSQSRHHLDQIALGASRSTIDNFSGSKFRAMKIPVPSLDDQRHISERLDHETGKIDFLVIKIEQFITLARERRAALITAAVTGQIDVRAAS